MKRRFLRRTAAGTVLGLAALGGGSAAAAATAPAPPTAVVQAASSAPTAGQATSTRVTRAVTSRSARSGDVTALLQSLVDDGALSADERDAIAADVARADGPAEDGPAEDRLSDAVAPADERLFTLRAAADVIGLGTVELRSALAVEGATLATVAGSRGVSVDGLVAGLVAAAGEHLDVAAAQGLIDADEAAGRQAELAAVVTDAVQAQYVDPVRSGSDRTV